MMSYPQPPQGPQQPPPVPPQPGSDPMNQPPYPQQQWAPPPTPPAAWYLKKWFVVLMIFIFWPVGLVLCWLSPQTKLVGRIIWTVLCGFGLLIVIAAAGSSPSSAPPVNSPAPDTQTVSAPPSKPAPAPVNTPAPPPVKKEPKWNTADLNIESNGNMMVAADVLKQTTPAALQQAADGSVAPATVNKQPWKYYGKALKLTGSVAIAQAYPPGSNVSKMLGGGDAGEIVMGADDGTIIDFMMIGDTGDVNVGDVATVYGYVVGQAEVKNKMGGQTTQMVIIGSAIKKGQ